MIYVFLAPGFEEIEALTPIDVLRRAELDVCVVGVGEDAVVGSHGIAVACDVEITQLSLKDVDMIVLPGGMPGTLNLEKNPCVREFINYAVENNIPIGAICAAPSILGHMGLLEGKKATCFTGFDVELGGAEYVEDDVVVDGNIITSRGMGTAMQFSLKLLEVLEGPAASALMAKKTLWTR